jgi:hypothetical protein
VQVALALVQVWILDIVEDGGELVEGTLHRPLRVDALFAEDRRGPPDQHGVVEDEQLGVEDGGEVAALERLDAPPDLGELFV